MSKRVVDDGLTIARAFPARLENERGRGAQPGLFSIHFPVLCKPRRVSRRAAICAMNRTTATMSSGIAAYRRRAAPVLSLHIACTCREGWTRGRARDSARPRRALLPITWNVTRSERSPRGPSHLSRSHTSRGAPLTISVQTASFSTSSARLRRTRLRRSWNSLMKLLPYNCEPSPHCT